MRESKPIDDESEASSSTVSITSIFTLPFLHIDCKKPQREKNPEMSSVILRSRLINLLSKCNHRLLSSNLASNPPKEPLITAEALTSDQPPPPLAPDSSTSSSKSWSFLKYSLVGALTGATTATGYVSYGMLGFYLN